MEYQLLIMLVAFVGVVVLYQILPYRELGAKKPFIALLPKYKALIQCDTSVADLSEKMRKLGFKKVSEENEIAKYSRGSIFGDFAIKLAKVDVYINPVSATEKEILVRSGLVAAFDTKSRDHWRFLNELSQTLETVNKKE